MHNVHLQLAHRVVPGHVPDRAHVHPQRNGARPPHMLVHPASAHTASHAATDDDTNDDVNAHSGSNHDVNNEHHCIANANSNADAKSDPESNAKPDASELQRLDGTAARMDAVLCRGLQ